MLHHLVVVQKFYSFIYFNQGQRVLQPLQPYKAVVQYQPLLLIYLLFSATV